jgi:hypothetical protein
MLGDHDARVGTATAESRSASSTRRTCRSHADLGGAGRRQSPGHVALVDETGSLDQVVPSLVHGQAAGPSHLADARIRGMAA